MGFSDSQKQQIKDYFDKGEYGIIARTAGLVTDDRGNNLDEDGQLCSETGKRPVHHKDWHMVTEPEWRWEKFEYRAYSALTVMPDETIDNPLFVYGYGYRIYYNEWNLIDQPVDEDESNMYNYSFDSVNLSSIFDGNVQITGDFRATGTTNTVGTGAVNNTSLTIIGRTHQQGSRLGPKVRFENADGSNFIDLVYTDNPSPSLTVSSNSNNEVFIAEREKVTNETVDNATITNLNATNASVEKLTVTNLTLRNVADVLYPVGSYYWSTNGTNPASLFGGNWVQITNAFLYASNVADQNATTAIAGSATVALSVDEMPNHNHSLYDPGHTHAVYDPGHNHGVIDPGHSHPIRTIGDDYNGSGQGGTGNFVGDGNSDMTNENWRRGLYATSSYTGISLAPSSSNISLSRVNSNLSLQSAGGNRPHNNMPPYIRAYCWHRVG
jgi:microcystin-dependent protein